MKQLLLAALIATSMAVTAEELTDEQKLEVALADTNYIWDGDRLTIFRDADPKAVCEMIKQHPLAGVTYVVQYNNMEASVVDCTNAKYTDETTEKPI